MQLRQVESEKTIFVLQLFDKIVLVGFTIIFVFV